MPVFAEVDCYQDQDLLLSFALRGPYLYWKHGSFRYGGLRNQIEALTPQLGPFRLRGLCAQNFWPLCQSLNSHVKQQGSYPAPAQWCDALVPILQSNRYNQEALKCPNAPSGNCSYAINPFCEPDSPPDTVLLFETRAGWNQHGGPQILSFNNHEPNGGNVLLKDGTVKFIRTEEELNQLRWE